MLSSLEQRRFAVSSQTWKRFLPKPGSPSLSGACFDEPMTALPGWGDTFFGVRDEFSVSATQLFKIAEEAYKEVVVQHPALTTLVVASYVPGEGFCLGTITHGAGMAKMASVAPNTASTPWEVLQERSLNDPTKSPSLYHDEDAATWYTYQKADIDKKKMFPLHHADIR